jgi:2'-5' RNA ligase
MEPQAMREQAWRLFIAIELPEAVLKAVSRFQTDLKKVIPPRAARWARPEGTHLTLKFLGDVPADRLPELSEALRRAAGGHHPLQLSVQGSGCFPNLDRPRVVWLGVAGELEALRSLQGGVEQQIAPLGFPPEERGFNPHLTLARTAQGASRAEMSAIGAAVRQRDAGRLAAWQVTTVSLMRSQLKPDGAVYTQVMAVTLDEQ